MVEGAVGPVVGVFVAEPVAWPDGRQVCDGASSPSSYQVSSVWPVRFVVLHRFRPTNRTQDTVVRPWPGTGRAPVARVPN